MSTVLVKGRVPKVPRDEKMPTGRLQRAEGGGEDRMCDGGKEALAEHLLRNRDEEARGREGSALPCRKQ